MTASATKRPRGAGAAGILALLASTASALRSVSSVTRAETELLLAHALGMDRAALLGASDSVLTDAAREEFACLVSRRARGEPMAYLLGRREFWSLPLRVTPAVLVPRPETELLVEWSLSFPRRRESSFSVLDLGTGSGAIALALAKECPSAKVRATDASVEALAVARENARTLGIGNVRFEQRTFAEELDARLRGHDGIFDVIVSNPPYVADGDPHLEDLRYEPAIALTAGPDGLRDLRTIVAGAPARLAPGGWLLVEHGSEQGRAVRELFKAAGFADIETRRDLAGLERATGGHRG